MPIPTPVKSYGLARPGVALPRRHRLRARNADAIQGVSMCKTIFCGPLPEIPHPMLTVPSLQLDRPFGTATLSINFQVMAL